MCIRDRYYSRQETVGPVDADKLFMLTTFIFEIIFGRNYDRRTSERLKLTADMLRPGGIRLYALIARGFNEKKSHIVEHHKKNGFPRTTHPKYEGGSKHLHDLKDSWHYFVEDYTTTHESGGFTVDLESVTQEEFDNAVMIYSSFVNIGLNGLKKNMPSEFDQVIDDKPIGP